MSQKRKIMRSMGAEYDSLSAKAKYLDLCRHGITPEMLKEEFDRGKQAGKDDCFKEVVTGVYSAALIVMRANGMRQDDMIQTLLDINSTLVHEIDSYDMAKRLLDDTGIIIDLDDPITPIKKVRDVDD